MKEDRIYMLRKITVMLTCMVVFVTVGLVVVNFQAKTVTIDYYGEKIQVNTMSNTVEGMLMQNGIYIDEKAIVYPNVETILKDNMEIKIYSEDEVATLELSEYRAKVTVGQTEKIIEEVQYIDFEKVQKSNANVNRGVTKVLQKGVNGQKTVIYTARYDTTNKVVSTNVISETIDVEPITQITEVGTKVVSTARYSAGRITAADLKVDSGFVKYNINLSLNLQKFAYNMCKKYNVPYLIFLGLMKVESNFRTEAKSSTGYGICQINPSNLSYLNKKLGTTDLFDPYQCIQAGAFWLSRYYNSWKKTTSGEELDLHALNSYNWGEGRYRTYLSAEKGRNAYSWFYGTKVLGYAKKIKTNGGL